MSKPPQNPAKILVICPNWVGDLVMATPALRAVRENNPRAHIALLVRPQIRAVVEGLDYFDEIIDYDSKSRHRGLRRKFLLSRALAQRGFNLTIIFPNSFGAAAIAWAAGIPCRVGYRTDGRGAILSAPIPPPREAGKVVPIPMVERYLRICRFLDYEISSVETTIRFSNGTRRSVDRIYQRWGINPALPLVSVIPGASFGSSKCWPSENFARLADALIEHYGVQVLIIPGPGEEEIALRIESAMRQRPFNFVKEILSLEDLKAVIHDAALVVTNDTGPRHFAVAFGTPVVVLMGPTDLRYTHYSLANTRILREDLACSPCHLKVCPIDHRCMKNITVDRALKACTEFLRRTT